MTTSGAAPVLNRLATLQLRGNEGTGPTLFAYTRAVLRIDNFIAGDWYAGRNTGAQDLFGNDIYQNYTPAVLASDVRHALLWALAIEDINGQIIDPNQILDGGQLFLFGPDDAVVTYTIDSAAPFTNDGGIALGVSGGILTGPDWTLEVGGTVSVGYSAITSIRAGALSTRKVWTRITERGAESGLLAIQAVESNIVIRESAEFVIRFIPPALYATITTLTDDYGRQWTVTSNRAILDRRYLSLECYR